MGPLEVELRSFRGDQGRRLGVLSADGLPPGVGSSPAVAVEVDVLVRRPELTPCRSSAAEQRPPPFRMSSEPRGSPSASFNSTYSLASALEAASQASASSKGTLLAGQSVEPKSPMTSARDSTFSSQMGRTEPRRWPPRRPFGLRPPAALAAKALKAPVPSRGPWRRPAGGSRAARPRRRRSRTCPHRHGATARGLPPGVAVDPRRRGPEGVPKGWA